MDLPLFQAGGDNLHALKGEYINWPPFQWQGGHLQHLIPPFQGQGGHSLMSNSWVYHCFKHEVILTIYMVHTYIGHLLGKTSPQVKISAQKKKESTSPSKIQGSSIHKLPKTSPKVKSWAQKKRKEVQPTRVEQIFGKRA